MYIHYRPAAALYRLAIGSLTVICTLLQFFALGEAAWRLFSTWVMLLTAAYFIVLSVITTFAGKRSLGKQNSPVFEGALITANVMLLIGTLIFWQLGWPVWGVEEFGGILLHFVVPILVFFDYLLFCRKGRFQTIFPLDWLVLPIVYAAIILISALNHVNTIELAIPYVFLNYYALGFWGFTIYLIIIAVLILTFGYVLFLIDFTLSGKLSKRIILPKLKAVEIEEAPAPALVSATKPVDVKPEPVTAPVASEPVKTPTTIEPEPPVAPKTSMEPVKKTKKPNKPNKPNKTDKPNPQAKVESKAKPKTEPKTESKTEPKKPSGKKKSASGTRRQTTAKIRKF